MRAGITHIDTDRYTHTHAHAAPASLQSGPLEVFVGRCGTSRDLSLFELVGFVATANPNTPMKNDCTLATATVSTGLCFPLTPVFTVSSQHVTPRRAEIGS